MRVITSIEEIRNYVQKCRKENKNIGLVPTMGALHKGHLKLVETAHSENEITIVSIFVNPTQFNNKEDFDKYPVSLEADLELIQDYADVVFHPHKDIIYKTPPTLGFQYETIANTMEGKFRPGHFSGVGLIVSKLFNIVSPRQSILRSKRFSAIRYYQKN